MATNIIQKEREQLIQKYPVPILHMRQQFIAKRFGLVFGAGIGFDLGFPLWDKLISDIAADDAVQGEFILANAKGKTITSQLLYQQFKEKYLRGDQGGERKKHLELYGDIEIRKKWKELVHKVLYKDIPKSLDELMKNDKYLVSLINIIKGSGTMTVTYNFDDTIERLLAKYKDNDENATEPTSRGYTVVWDPNVQSEKRSKIVYHPNGYLPTKISEFASEQLIFLEDTFEDQLIDSFKGHYNALNNHYSSNTCLFIGISMEDRTLKHMLRMNAKKCFGHTHYLVAIKDETRESDSSYKQYMESVVKTNFEVYNLYTLFLTTTEIKTLAELITMTEFDFTNLCEDIPKARKYFIMGAVAVGKSTTVNQFKCLQTYDEWLEEMPEDMEKSPDKPAAERIKEIDNWIADQIRLKNNLLLHMTDHKSNISIIDRTPLDAFAFTPDEEWADKARLIKSKLCGKAIACGKIIFLTGNIAEMIKRTMQKFRDYSQDALAKQQAKLRYIADGLKAENPDTIVIVDVTNKSIEQVTKEVAKIIYFDIYAEADFNATLNTILEKGKKFYE